MTQVFISYSHDDEAHSGRVLALAQRLRSEGLSVIIDRDHQATGGPPEGWPLWSDLLISPNEALFIDPGNPLYFQSDRGGSQDG
jgi:hypothetical protein